jgi:3-hydroxyisobutyrate dehydrogenase
MIETTDSPKVGFVGLGIMGAAMAGNIRNAGYPLHVHTRSKSKAADVLATGAIWHDHPGTLSETCDIVITIVGHPAEVESLYLGKEGLVERARSDSVLVDMTTSDPALAVRIAHEGAKFGVDVLDAPVSGGDVGARAGTLSIMAGGSREAFDKVRPVLKAMGQTIEYMGAPGQGQHAKLANQIVIAGTMMGVCEGLGYADAAGLDLQRLMKLIGSGAAGGFLWNNLGPRAAERDYRAGFFVEHFVKDLSIALKAAQDMQLELPSLELAKTLYERLVAQGYGRSGTQSLFALYDSRG